MHTCIHLSLYIYIYIYIYIVQERLHLGHQQGGQPRRLQDLARRGGQNCRCHRFAEVMRGLFVYNPKWLQVTNAYSFQYVIFVYLHAKASFGCGLFLRAVIHENCSVAYTSYVMLG